MFIYTAQLKFVKVGGWVTDAAPPQKNNRVPFDANSDHGVTISTKEEIGRRSNKIEMNQQKLEYHFISYNQFVD